MPDVAQTLDLGVDTLQPLTRFDKWGGAVVAQIVEIDAGLLVGKLLA